MAGRGCGQESGALVAKMDPTGNAAKQQPAPKEKPVGPDLAGKRIADALRPSDQTASLPWQHHHRPPRASYPPFLHPPRIPPPHRGPAIPPMAGLNPPA